MKQILRLYLTQAPAGWALIRTIECELLSKEKFKHPVLDIGCGDGFFASVLLKSLKKKHFEAGLDMDKHETKRAKKSSSYEKVYTKSILKMPFESGSFNTVFSNGTLEHVEGIEKAVKEISRVLKKNGRLIFTVPSSHLGSYLFFYRLFGWLRLKKLSRKYEEKFNLIFKHHNLFDHNKWEKLLLKNGFVAVDYKYYNTKSMISLHDILTWLALPNHLTKRLFGKWILFSQIRKHTLKLDEWLISKFYSSRTSLKKGGSLLIIAKKK